MPGNEVGNTTITIRATTKDRLAVLKGTKSWDAFLNDLADDFPNEEEIAEIGRRLDDLRSGRARSVPWDEVKQKARRTRRGP